MPKIPSGRTFRRQSRGRKRAEPRRSLWAAAGVSSQQTKSRYYLTDSGNVMRCILLREAQSFELLILQSAKRQVPTRSLALNKFAELERHFPRTRETNRIWD